MSPRGGQTLLEVQIRLVQAQALKRCFRQVMDHDFEFAG